MTDKTTIKTDRAADAGVAFPKATGEVVATHVGLDGEPTKKRALSDADIGALMQRTLEGPQGAGPSKEGSVVKRKTDGPGWEL
ncbi:MAG: hypothetical protein AAF988_00910 [Pseudomonadota bacterium]